MGTFANLYRESGAEIPKEKIEGFKKRLEALYQAGGMMELERVSLFGKAIGTIRKVAMHEYGMDFYYNYFEDDSWENAGFSIKSNHVWSGKIGWRQFHTAVVAAYVLEELYTDGTAIAMVDADPVTAYVYTGWINYLFQEKFHFKNRDPWKLFETMHKDEEYYRIYTFSDFFEETMENLTDKKYLALWKIYDDMLHSPELEEAGTVIFVPEGSEHEHEGLHYLGEQPRRRLITNWDIMEKDKRYNKAGVMLRRYMALVANKELREKVFGF